MEKKEKLPAPSNQIMVDWIACAWSVMCGKATTAVKSFFVTEISNTNGTWEERLYRDDDLRAEIEKEMESIFGSDQLSSCDLDSDDSDDPLATDDESDCNSDS